MEEEFNKNSKPDKASRMNIVSRVGMGEKEVQVRVAPVPVLVPVPPPHMDAEYGKLISVA